LEVTLKPGQRFKRLLNYPGFYFLLVIYIIIPQGSSRGIQLYKSLFKKAKDSKIVWLMEEIYYAARNRDQEWDSDCECAGGFL